MKWIGLGICACAMAYCGGGPIFMFLAPIAMFMMMAD